MNITSIIIIVLFLLLLLVAIIRSRKANPEQHAQEMHPSNYKKPKIERVEKNTDRNTEK